MALRSALLPRTRFALALVPSLLLPVTGCKNPFLPRSPSTGGDLSNLSSGDTNLEQKIDPVITCLNRTLSHFEELAPSYHQKIHELTSAPSPSGTFLIPDIPGGVFVSFKIEPYEQNGEFYKECEDGLDKAIAHSPSQPSLDDPAKDAAAALRALQPLGAQVDANLDQKAYLDDHAAKLQQLDATISPLLARLLKDSGQLRSAVFQAKATLVQHELDAIEKKSGRNLDWHTRQSMQAASVANREIQHSATTDTLNAASVDAAMQPLKSALEDTQSYLTQHPDVGKPDAANALPVWFSINLGLSNELGAMRTLRSDLAAPLDGNSHSQINTQLETINRSYNDAVTSYNQVRPYSVSGQ
jgi:hypothetical protein